MWIQSGQLEQALTGKAELVAWAATGKSTVIVFATEDEARQVFAKARGEAWATKALQTTKALETTEGSKDDLGN